MPPSYTGGRKEAKISGTTGRTRYVERLIQVHDKNSLPTVNQCKFNRLPILIRGVFDNSPALQKCSLLLGTPQADNWFSKGELPGYIQTATRRISPGPGKIQTTGLRCVIMVGGQCLRALRNSGQGWDRES
jgi:hypothetical protein